MIIEASNLSKVYNHSTKALHVLRGVNLQVQEGQIVSIVGPSGAGKSTLLHILGGLDKPNDGNVILDGQDIYGLSDRKLACVRNQKIGFIFQFYHLLSEFSALENVVLPAAVKNGTNCTKKLEQKGLELLDAVGLKERRDHKPSQLSGGEQQRVAIARALINEPKVILCDEPTGNLDSASGHEVINLLRDLNAKNKQTIIVVTHDEKIAEISNYKIHMKDGQLV